MAGGLAQPQQGLQHLDFGFGQAFVLNALQQRVAVVLAQFVVKLALGGFHLAVDGLLGFGGKFRRYLRLGPAEDERAQRVGQQAAGFLIGVAAPPHRSV